MESGQKDVVLRRAKRIYILPRWHCYKQLHFSLHFLSLTLYTASDPNTALKIQFQSTIRKKDLVNENVSESLQEFFFENNKTWTITKKSSK